MSGPALAQGQDGAWGAQLPDFMAAGNAPTPTASGRQRIVITPGNANERASAPDNAGDGAWASQLPDYSSEQKPPQPEHRKFGLMDTWPMAPVRGFLGAMKIAGGELDPQSPEAIEAVTNLASVGPGNVAVTAGDRAIPGMLRRGPVGETPTQSAAHEAASTAVDLGAPLPQGLTGGPAVQAVTQAARKVPGAGTAIDTRVGQTVTAAGERIGQMAGEMGGGVTDRPAVGANLRPSLQGVIDNNNARIDQAFDNLRGMINPDQVVRLPRTATTILPQTRATLQSIVDQRMAAGDINPVDRVLGPIDRLSTYGATFNGLQQARHNLAHEIDFALANPGMDVGALRRLYGSMSQDLGAVARAARVRRTGNTVGAVTNEFTNANSVASTFIQQSSKVQGLLRIKSDEGLVGSVMQAAQAKTGNVRLLAQLKGSMTPEDFQQIGAVALTEMGHSTKTQAFSLNQFTSRWGDLSDQGKALLFNPQHRAALDNIAQLGRHLKDADKYISTGSAPTNSMLAIGGIIGGSIMSGDPVKMGLTALGLGGGYTAARMLARPAGAAAVARWSRAATAYRRAPSAATRATVVVTLRDMVHNMNLGGANAQPDQYQGAP